MLLSAARACPTAKNLQGTRYISVTKAIPALLDAALDALGYVGAMQLKTATDPGELRRARNFIAWQQTRKEDKMCIRDSCKLYPEQHRNGSKACPAASA